MSIEVNPDEDFHVVVNGNVLALSLDALSAAYEGEVVEDESLIWQPGLGEWMRLDAVLAQLEQQEPPAAPQAAATVDEDMYFVQVAEDEVKQMSLDQLDTAFRVDIIDLSTLVWQPGYTEWVPLAVLLGDEPEQNHYSLAPSMPAPLPAPSLAPVSAAAFSQSAASSQSAAFSQNAPSFAPQPYFNAAASRPSSVAPASMAPSPFGPGPYDSPSYAPSSAPSFAPNSLTAVAASFIPDLPAPAPKASRWYARTLVAAAALTTLGVAHRYGAGYEIASTLDGNSADKAWAARVGEPTTDTPYGLNRWLGQVEKKYALDELSATEAVAARPTVTATATAPAPLAASHVALTAPAAPIQAATDKPVTAQPATTVNAFGNALANRPAPAKTASTSTSRKYKPSTKKKTSASKSSGNAYDPMNGNL